MSKTQTATSPPREGEPVGTLRVLRCHFENAVRVANCRADKASAFPMLLL